jgi:hypothetical protein
MHKSPRGHEKSPRPRTTGGRARWKARALHKLSNVTLFSSSMTYLDITFKNLTLKGSKCICFKCKYK